MFAADFGAKPKPDVTVVANVTGFEPKLKAGNEAVFESTPVVDTKANGSELVTDGYVPCFEAIGACNISVDGFGSKLEIPEAADGSINGFGVIVIAEGEVFVVSIIVFVGKLSGNDVPIDGNEFKPGIAFPPKAASNERK